MCLIWLLLNQLGPITHIGFLSVLLLLSLQCSAYLASDTSEKTWTMRTTFPEYVVALATIVGSVLFTVSSLPEIFTYLCCY